MQPTNSGVDESQRNCDAGGRQRLPLGAEDVHVWWVAPEITTAPAVHHACWRLLSPGERRRHDRLRVPDARMQYLTAHALLRAALSAYAPVDPAAWQFVTNAHGRPEIAAPLASPSLRFNLSHTHGAVVCGVTLARDLGVDVEALRERPRMLDIARRFFAPSEAQALAAIPAAQQLTRFVEYWTLKEAYIKARGLGLSLAVGHVAFDLQMPPAVNVAFAPELRDDPSFWHFVHVRLTPGHILAVAAHRPPATKLNFDLRHAAGLLTPRP
jgi:4'-phosphopantetheinyl transferase